MRQAEVRPARDAELSPVVYDERHFGRRTGQVAGQNASQRGVRHDIAPPQVIEMKGLSSGELVWRKASCKPRRGRAGKINLDQIQNDAAPPIMVS